LDAIKQKLERQAELMQYLDEAKWYRSLSENFSEEHNDMHNNIINIS